MGVLNNLKSFRVSCPNSFFRRSCHNVNRVSKKKVCVCYLWHAQLFFDLCWTIFYFHFTVSYVYICILFVRYSYKNILVNLILKNDSIMHTDVLTCLLRSKLLENRSSRHLQKLVVGTVVGYPYVCSTCRNRKKKTRFFFCFFIHQLTLRRPCSSPAPIRKLLDMTTALTYTTPINIT